MSKLPKIKFGKAFSDELAKVRSRSGSFHRKKTNETSWQHPFLSDGIEDATDTLNTWRKLFLAIGVLILFSILFVRLFHLQVVEGSYNRELADSNRIKTKVIHAPRGVVYDRNGKILAQNEPGFRLVEATDGANPKVTHLSRDEALSLEATGDKKIEDLEIDSNRTYPLGMKASHVLGYVSEITEEELKDPDYKNYKAGDKIGRGGIEQVYEKILRGIDGGEIIEVDAAGKKIRTIRKKEAIPGQNLYLTIDADLQAKAYDLLQEGIQKSKVCCGSLISEDPNSGQILSLVSIPSFDPLNIQHSLDDPNSPFLNRSISGVYPPGSTYKIASSLAGLISGKFTPSTTVEDTGVMNLGTFKFANWYFTQYGKTEGPVDLVKALKRSNDIYFYKVGHEVGEETLAKVSRDLGLGKKLGIDLPGEAAGTIPDNDWKVKNMGQIWYPGDSLHMAIGQGFVLTTPLQVSHLVSIVAANGKQYPPHLALRVTDQEDKEIKRFDYDPISSQKLNLDYLNKIKQGLEEVPKTGGTAWPFFTFPIQTAGKTGTAEYGDPEGNTHAWYTGYAPIDEPQLAVTVLVEKGGEGSSVASPIVKEVFRWYFSEDKRNLLKDITPVIATDSARTLGE